MKESGAAVLLAEYSNTSDATSVQRFEPDGKTSKDDGWDQEMLEEMADAMGDQAPAWAKKRLKQMQSGAPTPRSTERLQMLAVDQRFAITPLELNYSPGRPMEMSFVGYPAQAFDAVALITS